MDRMVASATRRRAVSQLLCRAAAAMRQMMIRTEQDKQLLFVSRRWGVVAILEVNLRNQVGGRMAFDRGTTAH